MSSNQSPVANPDVLEILADTPFVVAADDLLSNDTDADGDSLTISSWGNADHVSVTRLSDGSFSITPVANYSGPASFTYTISDGNGGTSTTTVNISVVSEDGNTPPLAVDDSASTNEDTPLVLPPAALLSNDIDSNGDTITITAVGDAVNGTVAIDGAGNVVFTPNANYNGPASFSYTVDDGQGGTATATVNVDVVAVNDAPVVANSAATTSEDTPLVIAPTTLTANGSDVDGDALTVSAVGNAVHGTVSIDSAGNVVFTPAANYNGPASFSYTVSDGHGGTATATVNVNVTAVNDAPVAGNDSATATEDTALVITPATLLANDSDVDGNPLSISSVGNATHGTVALNNGNVVFTPAANYNGPASFTYTVSDGQGGSTTATVNVNVTAVNDAPVAGNDSVTTTEDTPLVLASGALLANDTDVDGNPLSITAVGNATHGTVALSNGNITFTPAANYNGPASFTYTVSDGQGGTATATVNVNVGAANDAPVANNDSVTATEDTPLVLSPAALLGNDTDPDGNTLSIASVGNATHGTVALSNGNVVFTPTANYNGAASFTYTISDGQGGTATATVNVNVAAVNDAPVAANDSVIATEDTPLVLAPATLLANDSDVDGNTLSIASVGGATHGTVALSNGNVVFTPAANYNGPASFTYTTSDGQGGTATATVNVNVTAVNDAPVAANDSVTATEDTPLVLTPATLLGNDSDVDGNTLSISSVGGATHGTVALSNGNVVFTPAANYNGPASFTYTVSDGQGGTATATVNVAVNAVNDAPVAHPDSIEVATNTPVVLAPADLLGNDTDPDGDALSIISVGSATHGTVTRSSDGDITFTPAPGYSGPASFVYTVSDGHGGQASTTVSVNVVSDGGSAPELGDAPAVGFEDTKIPLSIVCTVPAGYSAQDVTIKISDVPAGATLSAGTNLGDGAWSLTMAQLTNLKLTPPKNSGVDFDLKVTATGPGGTATMDLPVKVAAVADAPTLSVATPTVVTANGFVRNGTSHDDRLFGGAGSDTISGGGGDDRIVGDRAPRPSSAPLTISAGLTDLDGSETLSVRVSGVPSQAWLSAGTHNIDGSWTLTAAQLSGLEVLFPPNTPAFTMTITATATDHDADSGAVDTESVSTTIQVHTRPEGNDVLHGGDGNDQIWGTGGHDTISGDNGNDFLFGGLGNDSMTGDSGNDGIYGGGGNDTVSGGTGRDILDGNGGNDRLFGGDDNDWLNGGSGNDSLSGDKGNDRLFGESGHDSLSGGDGDDWLSGGSDNDSLSGDAGNDQLSGDSGNDILAGGSGRDMLSGGDGNDTLNGGDDNDRLLGGNGNDLLSGGAGQDWIEGGRGNDTLTGGTGNDRFVFNNSSQGVDTITDFSKGDVIDISDILPGSVHNGHEAAAGGFVKFVQSGADTLVEVDHNGGGDNFQTLAILKGVSAATLHPDDMLVV
ncbi:MAG TPA: cadherin-like domain-containing protein [Candidatus Angelobacter sp.]|nr:cadherin-like domain-containing protein [Candidatus Angelobacter sp.]